MNTNVVVFELIWRVKAWGEMEWIAMETKGAFRQRVIDAFMIIQFDCGGLDVIYFCIRRRAGLTQLQHSTVA